MEVYNVGSDELDFSLDEKFLWVVYSYESDYYEGYGEAVAYDKNGNIHIFGLGHCSCYGPLEDWPHSDEIIKVEDYLGGNALVCGRSGEVYEKVKGLLDS